MSDVRESEERDRFGSFRLTLDIVVSLLASISGRLSMSAVVLRIRDGRVLEKSSPILRLGRWLDEQRDLRLRLSKLERLIAKSQMGRRSPRRRSRPNSGGSQRKSSYARQSTSR